MSMSVEYSFNLLPNTSIQVEHFREKKNTVKTNGVHSICFQYRVIVITCEMTQMNIKVEHPSDQ